MLIKYLSISTLKTNNKNTTLGYAWWLLEPLLLMLVYYIVVSVIFDRGGPNYPLFVFLALLPWRAFSTSVTSSMGSLTSNESLIKQILFPKAILPIAANIAGYVNFTFGLPIVLGMVFLFGIDLSLPLIIFPLIVAIQFIFTLGVSLFLSAINVFYKDVQTLMTHILRAWWYLSPGLYSIDLVPDNLRSTYSLLNPFAVFFTSYRDVVMFGRWPDLFLLGWVLFISSVVLVIGMIVFIRKERSFVKVL